MPEYILDPIAEDDLWNVWLYIAEENPEAANRLLVAAYETFQVIADSPNIGTKRHFRPKHIKDIRSWHVKGFRLYQILYRPIPTGIQVVHVCHSARDIDALFGKK